MGDVQMQKIIKQVFQKCKEMFRPKESQRLRNHKFQSKERKSQRSREIADYNFYIFVLFKYIKPSASGPEDPRNGNINIFNNLNISNHIQSWFMKILIQADKYGAAGLTFSCFPDFWSIVKGDKEVNFTEKILRIIRQRKMQRLL